MGVWYRLVNVSKGEQITFHQLPTQKPCELAGNPASAAIVCWYLLKNAGDRIGFVSDDLAEWPFDSSSLAASRDFPDVTESYLNQLINEGILCDNGLLWQDEQEPELLYRDIRNSFMPKELL